MPTVELNGTVYNIELVEADNQSDKVAAVAAAESLIAEGVAGVIGSYGSGVSNAAGQTFADANRACHRRILHESAGNRRQ